jgi:hypothetical protein
VNEDEILNSGLLGEYRRESGWDEWAERPEFTSQFWRMSQIMNGGREVSASRKAKKLAEK